MADITKDVDKRPFNGSCVKCQGPASKKPVTATALIRSNVLGGRYSATAADLVVCDWEGHTYYVIDWSKEVVDPFAPPAPK